MQDNENMECRKQGVEAEPADAMQMPRQDGLPQKNQWLFSLLFIAIAVFSVLAVVMQSREFSISQFLSFIKNASLPWLLVSLLSMLCFVLFEGIAILCICRAFGYRRSLNRGYIYSASDIYFSALTPSATGGQPASAFFMIKDGIPAMTVTVILVANLAMYTLSIIAIGAICFLFSFDTFLQFDTLSKILIVVGTLAQFGLAFFFVMLLKSGRLLHRICRAALRLLIRIRIIRRAPEKKMEKLDAAMEKYRGYAEMLSGHKKALLLAFLFNLIQRSAQIAVTMFTYLATGGAPDNALSLWTLQGYVVLGSNCVPIPGAMGVSDYIMLDGFRSIMSESDAVNLELLSRSCSFYVCILLCGVSTLIYYRLLKKRRTSL